MATVEGLDPLGGFIRADEEQEKGQHQGEGEYVVELLELEQVVGVDMAGPVH